MDSYQHTTPLAFSPVQATMTQFLETQAMLLATFSPLKNRASEVAQTLSPTKAALSLNGVPSIDTEVANAIASQPEAGRLGLAHTRAQFESCGQSLLLRADRVAKGLDSANENGEDAV